MTVAPELAQLLTSLAALAARNTASAISTRVQAIRASKQQAEVVNQLVEIINDLIDDRNQLLGIARGLEDELVAQRISNEEINYIIQTIIPTVEELARVSGEASANEFIEPLKSILSVETLTILQLVGFNFKAAIGEPLTQLVERMILSKVPDADTSNAVSVLAAKKELAYLEVVQDPAAFERLRGLQG